MDTTSVLSAVRTILSQPSDSRDRAAARPRADFMLRIAIVPRAGVRSQKSLLQWRTCESVFEECP